MTTYNTPSTRSTRTEIGGRILEVDDLHTHFRTRGGDVHAVDGVAFDLHRGETLALVGESGCGKSVTALSLMRLLPLRIGRIVSGQVRFEGEDLVDMEEEAFRRIRGKGIAMVFQDPMTSLNPVLTVGRQISEILRLHLGMNHKAARRRVIELLELVGIPEAHRRVDDYPHQFSGGMRQRVMIAMALSCEPEVVIADEPTTALDVTIQAQILELLTQLSRERDTSFLLITHDLGIVAGMTQRVHVMYAGQIVEKATTSEIFANPRMPYTWGLLRSVPRLDEERQSRLATIGGSPPLLLDPPQGCRFAGRCPFAREVCRERTPDLLPVPASEAGHESRCWAVQDVSDGGWLLGVDWQEAALAFNVDATRQEHPSRQRPTEVLVRDVGARASSDTRPAAAGQPLVEVNGLTVHFARRGPAGSRTVRAVNGVDLSIRRGETLGLVGESGCGKSTTGRALLQLLRPTAGSVRFDGVELTTLRPGALRRTRRRMQMIFQDPYASLDPRQTLHDILAEPLRVHGLAPRSDLRGRVRYLLELVGLNPDFADRYPHEFSGGQRQRIGIARALAVDPEFVVADEPISSLDVSVQAQIINLLEDLRTELDLTLLFIAHDLAVVRHICDRVAVMYLGRIVEIADRSNLYERPRHPYTVALLSAVPIPDPVAEAKRQRVILAGDVPTPMAEITGCPFRTRCPRATQLCAEVAPQLEESQPGHWAACHHPVEGVGQSLLTLDRSQ